MAKKLITTNELYGMRVIGGKSGARRIGKVREFVFHPKEKRCIGFTVKRPDLLWMFKRRDSFVPYDGYDIEDGRVSVHSDIETSGRAAAKRMDIDWNTCVFWIGMPLIAEKSGRSVGRVGNVIFDQRTGMVDTVETDLGATANTLLGRREISSDLILGFKMGAGEKLSLSKANADDENPTSKEESDKEFHGAILVSEEVVKLETEGGLAEKAGKTTAVVTDKASKAAAKVSKQAGKAAKKTGEVVNKGAYLTGKQIGKTKGMFSAFKEEYDKARHDEDE